MGCTGGFGRFFVRADYFYEPSKLFKLGIPKLLSPSHNHRQAYVMENNNQSRIHIVNKMKFGVTSVYQSAHSFPSGHQRDDFRPQFIVRTLEFFNGINRISLIETSTGAFTNPGRWKCAESDRAAVLKRCVSFLLFEPWINSSPKYRNKADYFTIRCCCGDVNNFNTNIGGLELYPNWMTIKQEMWV